MKSKKQTYNQHQINHHYYHQRVHHCRHRYCRHHYHHQQQQQNNYNDTKSNDNSPPKKYKPLMSYFASEKIFRVSFFGFSASFNEDLKMKNNNETKIN